MSVPLQAIYVQQYFYQMKYSVAVGKASLQRMEDQNWGCLDARMTYQQAWDHVPSSGYRAETD